MRWSQVGLVWQVVSLAAFFAVMAGVWFVARWLIYDVTPTAIVGYLAVGMFGLLFGFRAGETATTQALKHNNPNWPFVRIKSLAEVEVRRDLWQRRKRFFLIYGALIVVGIIGVWLGAPTVNAPLAH